MFFCPAYRYFLPHPPLTCPKTEEKLVLSTLMRFVCDGRFSMMFKALPQALWVRDSLL